MESRGKAVRPSGRGKRWELETMIAPLADKATPETILELSPLRGFDYCSTMLTDVMQGVRLLPLAAALGWLDIKMRYRGSILGPLWLTISTAVMVAALGFLYAELFHIPLKTYLPFLSLSLVLWGFMSTVALESTTVFAQEARVILAARMPYTVHASRALIRNYLVLAHNAFVVVIVFFLFGIVPFKVYLVIPALLLWTLDGFLLMLLLGIVGARYRDVPPVVASLLQIFFFVTPVIWRPELVGSLQHWLLFDPFFSLLTIVRAPLMGEVSSWQIWVTALGHSAVLLIITFAFFARFRSRIAYWV